MNLKWNAAMVAASFLTIAGSMVAQDGAKPKDARPAVVGDKHDTSDEIQGRVREWESKADSRNGDWGPSAMALALAEYGAKGYEVRAYATRQGALRDAARSIQRTNSPAILLAWRGAHTWVMTGFRADADPSVFAGLEQTPLDVLHVPAVWHWSLAVQVTGFEPVQTPV